MVDAGHFCFAGLVTGGDGPTCRQRPMQGYRKLVRNAENGDRQAGISNGE